MMQAVKWNQRSASVISQTVATVLAYATATAAISDTTPVGSTFTYQGRLTEAGEPASEPVDLVFRLFDGDSGGDPLSTLVADEFPLGDDGHFTIDLDFGQDMFNGEPRWLEIEVNEVVLSPRQPIMAAPHAMVATTAANVPTKAVVGFYGGITGVGTLNSLNVAGTATFGGEPTYVQVNGPLGHATFNNHLLGPILTLRNSSGSATSNLGKLVFEDTVGTKASIEYLNQAQGVNALRFLGADGNPDMLITEAGNVGIGTGNPAGRLHVAGVIRATIDAINPAIDASQNSVAAASAIHGKSWTQSSHGTAVFGDLLSSTPGFKASGVRGVVRDDGSNGIGVLGLHEGTGVGVKGESAGTGVYGLATGNFSGGVQYGIKGHSSSINGYAGYFTGGKNYFEGRIGVGTLTPAGRLQINASGDEPALRAMGDSEINEDTGGLIRVGPDDGSGPVIAMDGDDIVSRFDGGVPATLRLNAFGGAVAMGEHGIRPAHAYGKVFHDGTVLSASSNVIGVTGSGGEYDIEIEGGWNSATDIAIVTVGGTFNGASIATNGNMLRVTTYDLIQVIDDRTSGIGLVTPSPVSFHFVIYRP